MDGLADATALLGAGQVALDAVDQELVLQASAVEADDYLVGGSELVADLVDLGVR